MTLLINKKISFSFRTVDTIRWLRSYDDYVLIIYQCRLPSDTGFPTFLPFLQHFPFFFLHKIIHFPTFEISLYLVQFFFSWTVKYNIFNWISTCFIVEWNSQIWNTTYIYLCISIISDSLLAFSHCVNVHWVLLSANTFVICSVVICAYDIKPISKQTRDIGVCWDN